jgi:hypothetical protein
MGQTAVLAPARDRRTVERIPTSLRGKVFPGALDCVIADFTKHGARLRFDETAPIENAFVMVVWSSGFAFEAETRWRHNGEIGVRFVGSRDLRRPAPAHLAEIQALWRRRRPRLRRKALVASPAILTTPRRLSRSGRLPPP